MGFFNRLFGGQSVSRDFYEQGFTHEANTDHDQSLASFTEAIRLDPKFPDAYYARAFVREITGEYEQAIADFERAGKLAPKVGDELVVEPGEDGSARVIRLRKDVTWNEGAFECGTALDIARVCYLRGVQAVDRAEHDKAIEAFTNALERAHFADLPEEILGATFSPPSVYFERGRCYSRTGRLQEAVADLTKAAQFNLPNEEFRHHVHLLLGQCHLHLHDYDGAIACLTQAINAVPTNAEAFASRADAHHEKGNPDQAIADINESIRLDRQCVRSYVTRSNFFADQKEFARAVADADVAVRLAPEDWSTRMMRAAIHQQMGEYQKAIADYTEAIRLNPDEAFPYRARAIAYGALGDQKKAARDEQSAQAVTYLQQAFAELQQQNWDQAVWVLGQAIQLDPSMHRGYLRRGMAYIAKMEPDKAIADFTYIIDKLPKPTLHWGPTFGAYVDAFVNRGNAYMVKGQFQKAIGDYTEAIRQQPELASVYQHRAEAYRAVGEIGKALKDEQTAQQSHE